VFIYGLSYFLEVSSLPSGLNLLLIKPVFIILVSIIIIYIIFQLINYYKGGSSSTEDKEEAHIDWKKTIYFCITTILYVFLLEYIGFIPITLLYTVILMWGLGVRSVRIIFLTSIILVAVLYVSLDILLNIKLPNGILMFVGGLYDPNN